MNLPESFHLKSELVTEDMPPSYKELLDSLPDVVITMDINGSITFVNQSVFDFLGWQPTDIIGYSLFHYCDDKKRLEELFEKLSTSGQARNFKLLFQTKEGQRKTGEANLRCRYDESQLLIEISGTIRDITHEVAVDNEVAKVKEFYETILNTIDADVAVFDKDSRYRFLNGHAVSDPNLRQWLIGKNDLEYCLERGKDTSIAETRVQMHKELLQNGIPVQWIEELTDKQQVKHYILRILKTFLDTTGEPHIVGYGIDITHLKETENDLVEKESYLRSLLHSLPDNIFRINKEGRFIDLTINNEQDLATKADQLVGKTLHEIWPTSIADEYLEFVHQALQTGEVVTYEYQRADQLGKLSFYEARISKKSADEVVAVIRNITDQKDAESRILNATIQSEENERNRIAGELHDGVCQELTAAKLTIELAEAVATSENEAFGLMLQKSKDIILKALNSIRRASHQLMSSKLNELGFRGMLEALVDELNSIDSIKYDLQWQGNAVEPPFAVATNLMRIVQEFIRNSQKHADTKTVSISVQFGDKRLALQLRDFGKGFTVPKHAEKQGIGIFNMLNRVKAIGGQYQLEAAPGNGVSLLVTVPFL